MATFLRRMLRAARLDAALYEEVEADEGATFQAMAVVVLASVAAGIGSAAQADYPLARGLYGLFAALFGWFVWAFVTYVFGSKLFPEPATEANLGQLLRTIGFSSSPGVLRLFGFVPLVGGWLAMLAAVWMLVAMVIAVRQALDYRSTARAIGVCLLGWVVQLLLWLPLLLGMAVFGES